MKKTFLIIAALLCAWAAGAKSVKLNPGVWDAAGAKFAVWHWVDGAEGSWSAFMTKDADEDCYVTEISDASNNIVFVRINGSATAPGWDEDVMWNQTEDLMWQEGIYSITGWGNLGGKSPGSWQGSSETPDGYYLTGDGTWTGGPAWNAQAAKLTDGKLVLNLKAGTYKCKITNGTWNPGGFWGASSVGADCTNVSPSSDDDGNIVFELAKDTEVTFSFDGTNVCINAKGGSDAVVPTRSHYASAVPSQSTDIMLQAFFYDSYKNQKYTNAGSFPNTKWEALNSQASEFGAYFDLIWLPPSSKSSGGTGYHPSQYNNQNSDWGSRTELEKFITAMHSSPQKTKVVADIVINHAANKSTWCDYYTMDFGKYGAFTPTAAWICKTDEVNSSSSGACKGKATGDYDDGYGGDANYAAARDWDHKNAAVQNMFKAYLKWMYDEIGYDGWRYDYCKGFHNSHINDYNKASGAYFSVMEYWDGNPQTLKSRIGDAGNNTLTFDFATKYTAINDPDNSKKGIAGGNYSTLKGAGLPGIGMGKYAVTFVDSHDTFERDVNEFIGKDQSMKAANKDKLLQANAYILCMPGIPCVFYPHWYKYKTEIGKMVMARHAAQVHSESAVDDEADASGYKAVVTGKNGGSLILLLGNRVSQTIGSDYKLAVKGTGYAVYYKAASGSTGDLVLTVSPGSSVFKDKTNGIDVTVKAVALSGTPSVYYTTDGSEPTTASSKLSGTTLNFKATTTLKVMAVCGSSKTAVQTYTFTYKEPQTTPIVVKFYKPLSWKKVCLWAWEGGDAVKTTFKTWPGVEMTDTDENGYYMYQFDASVKDVKFIFNCGSNECQTSDLWTDENVCYSWSVGAEKLQPDCAKPVDAAVDDIQAKPASVKLYPNPVHSTLHIETQETVSAAYVYTITGQCQRVEQGNVRELNVEGMPDGMYLLNLHMKDGKQNTTLFIKE